jgi:hypothetical protein
MPTCANLCAACPRGPAAGNDCDPRFPCVSTQPGLLEAPLTLEPDVAVSRLMVKWIVPTV